MCTVILLAFAVISAARAEETPGFVGSDACGACHEAQFDAWQDSHHGWALREPAAENVLGDFDDATFEHKGVVSRFFREGEDFFIETDGADGRLARFKIRYVVGVEPLQQYLVELDGGRLQALDLAWDTEAKRWYHLYPQIDVSAGNGLHWTGPYKNWQARCAVCHQTDFRKNYDPKTRSYHTAWSELTVGCESCHGPGEAHIAWARDDDGVKDWTGLTLHGLVAPASSDRQTNEQNMCGPCHSRRESLGPDSTPPGDPFADHYNLATLGDGLYFDDGQQDEEVYILGSFLQSKMHEKGVTCSNCHDPHSGQLVAEGNAVCTQCHNEAGRQEFPTLVLKDFDTPDHHHHPNGSAGAQCDSCHMPERDYMVVDGRRDHFFRVPDPLLSEKVGSPDACLSCHEERDAAWAAAAIADWAPGRPPADHHTAMLFDAVRKEGLTRNRLLELAELARDTDKPAIVRATALREIVDQADEATRQSLSGLLGDPSDIVRQTAVRLWRSAPPAERVRHLLPLLDDPVASVRVATALELASLPPDALPQEQRPPLQDGLGALRASMTAKADFPETQMAIGGLAMVMRNWTAAQAAFAEAVFMDPQLVQAWITRARIAEALGETSEATAILRSGRKRNPGDPLIAAALAQRLMQEGRLSEAVPIFKEAVAADPTDQDMRINLAYALLQSGDLSAAGSEIELLRARTPYDAMVMMLYGLHQLATGDIAAARTTTEDFTQRHPGVRLPPQLDALMRTR